MTLIWLKHFLALFWFHFIFNAIFLMNLKQFVSHTLAFLCNSLSLFFFHLRLLCDVIYHFAGIIYVRRKKWILFVFYVNVIPNKASHVGATRENFFFFSFVLSIRQHRNTSLRVFFQKKKTTQKHQTFCTKRKRDMESTRNFAAMTEKLWIFYYIWVPPVKHSHEKWRQIHFFVWR